MRVYKVFKGGKVEYNIERGWGINSIILSDYTEILYNDNLITKYETEKSFNPDNRRNAGNQHRKPFNAE